MRFYYYKRAFIQSSNRAGFLPARHGLKILRSGTGRHGFQNLFSSPVSIWCFIKRLTSALTLFFIQPFQFLVAVDLHIGKIAYE